MTLLFKIYNAGIKFKIGRITSLKPTYVQALQCFDKNPSPYIVIDKYTCQIMFVNYTYLFTLCV